MSALDIFFNLDVLERAFPILLRGMGMTLLLGFTAILFGTLLGWASPWCGFTRRAPCGCWRRSTPT